VITRDFLGNEWEIDCLGCAISAGRMPVPGGMIHQTQHFCVHQDPLVPLPGFLVIATVRHIRSLSQFQGTEHEEFFDFIKTAHRAIKESVDAEYLTTIQEESSPHFHLWFFPWSPGVIRQYGSPSLVKIREIMADKRKRPIDAEEWIVLEGWIEKIKSYWSEKVTPKSKG
jgi:diadenosine tetraphosphate (Ap4A) HIT family hydrolase